MYPVSVVAPDLYLLLLTAAGTAVVHTLIPDHWLPFVLIGRARGWSARTTAVVSGFSALIHVALSIALASLTVGLGIAASQAIGESLGRAGGALLVLFGLIYALWAWRKGDHFHPGGRLLHARDRPAACEGREGDAHPEHLYFHADDEMIRAGQGWSRIALSVIVGANPCVLLIPILLAAAEQGAAVLWLVSAAYAGPTVVLMVGLSALGVVGARRIRLPAPARHMELASGLLIALLGGLFLWFD